MVAIFHRPPEAATRRLLEASALPTEDLTAAHFENFLGCGSATAPSGVVGVEIHGEDALLRSLAVDESARGKGCGAALVAAVERRARERGAKRVFLLTTTAAAFFERLGYRPTSKDEAPPAIRATPEFTSLCPATSAFMVKEIAGS